MEAMGKQVQIPYELFMDLVYLFVLEMPDEDTHEKIVDGLNKKIDKIILHELYEKYKTAPTEEEREKARQEYLDKRGVFENFRW